MVAITGIDPATLGALYRLRPRAFAAVVRRFILPIEILLRDGAYGPFVAAFSRACDGAEPWYALGHDPRRAPRLELDAVELRGSPEERQLWGTLWSASRAMELARKGNMSSACSQFSHALNLIREWSPRSTLGGPSEMLLGQASEYVTQVAKSVSDGSDPPLDGDALVVPGFILQGPTVWEGRYVPPQCSPPKESSDLSFDAEVNSLIDLLKNGRAVVFCGAGISIASGIPSAQALRTALLQQLPASEREVNWLTECDLPLEAFLEPLLGETDFRPLLALFARGEPGPAHDFLADLAGQGLLHTIATTNFDELIERALTIHHSRFRVGYRHEDLAAVTRPGEGVGVAKLHGTVSSPESVALVMEQVAGRHHVLAREKAVTTVFAHGSHDAVLVLGYSCSDVFDISPAIEALGSAVKRVYFVQHEASELRAEDIRLRPRKNPFRRCLAGTRLVCDTDALLTRLSRAITNRGVVSPSRSPTDQSWQTSVQRWWSQLSARETQRVGHHILGLVWYRCGDYRAAKAHFRAALSAATPRVVVHHGVDFLEGLAIARPTVSAACHSEALLRVGGCHRALSEYRDAMRRFREAEQLARQSGEREIEAAAADSVGTVLFNTGEFAEAVRCHEHSARIWRSLGDQPRQLGSCLANLGTAYGAMRRLDEALACFQEGIELARETGDKMGEGSRLGGMGQVLHLRGDWSAGEAAFLAALDIAQSLGDRSGIAHQFGGLALVNSARGDLDKAIENGVTAASLFEELGDRQGQARVLGNLGGDFLSIGRIDAGVECLIRALEMAAAIGDATVQRNAAGHLEHVINWMAANGASQAESDRAAALLREFCAGHSRDIRPLESALGQLVKRVGDGQQET